MKTDELIAMLANSAGAVEQNALARRYGSALGWGAFGAMSVMVIMLGVRQDIYEAARQPMFWIKLAFPASLAFASLVAAARLSRPGAHLGWVPAALAAPVFVMWLSALFALSEAAPSEREDLILGVNSSSCAINIAMLSLPVFVSTLWAMKGLAPTRLALAGAAAGLLAGAIGALVYALSCIETGTPFLGAWYVAGMLIPAALGALLGPRVLRW